MAEQQKLELSESEYDDRCEVGAQLELPENDSAVH